MAKNTNQRAAKSNSTITAVSVAVIIAVLALSIIAIYPVLKSRGDEKAKEARMEAIANGSAPVTVEFAADQDGKTVEEYLAQFGYEVGEDGINADTLAADLQPTVMYVASQKDMTFEDFLAEYGLDAEQVTKKTPIADVIPTMTVEQFAKMNDSDVEAYTSGLTDAITGETVVGDMYNMTVADVIGEEAFNSLQENGAFSGVEEGVEMSTSMTWSDFCSALDIEPYLMPTYLQVSTGEEEAPVEDASEEATAEEAPAEEAAE